MRSTRAIVSLGLLLVAAATPSAATTLVAPSLSPLGAQVWYCAVENVGKKPIDVTVTQYDTAGVELAKNTITANPFQPFSIGDAGIVGGTCRLDFAGSRKTVRAFICIFDGSAGCVHIMPAQ